MAEIKNSASLSDHRKANGSRISPPDDHVQGALGNR